MCIYWKNSCRIITLSLTKLVLGQIFMLSFHNLFLSLSRTTTPLTLFSELCMNVFVLDYFSSEVIFSYFQALCYCLSCNLKFFLLMTGTFPGWGHFVALIMPLFSHLRQDFRCVLQINKHTKYLLLLWVGDCFKSCLFATLLVLHCLAEQLQRLIYLEGWQGLCWPSVISFSRESGIIPTPWHPVFPAVRYLKPLSELRGTSQTVLNQIWAVQCLWASGNIRHVREN